MYAEAIALLAAFSFGITAVVLKKGYRYSTPLASSLVVLIVNTVILWIITLLFVPLELFLSTAIIFFVIGGILAQGIARTLRYTGIHKIGPSRTYAVIGTSPVFAAIFAVMFLSEQLTIALTVGTLFVVSGVILLSLAGNHKNWKKSYLLLPITAAVLYGAVAVIKKFGLEIVGNTIVGATTAVSTGLLFMLLYLTFSGKIRKIKIGKAMPYFITAGIFNSIAFTLTFEAIRTGKVTVAMPLLGTQPLFVTALSFLFLKNMEKLNWKIVTGAIIVVAGAAIITVF